MITYPTNYLVLEGPDLAGKGTLYRNLHKASSYRWNIQDRSFLSMLVYAKMYGRDTGLHARGLWGELTNLNNRFILMLPTYEAVLERYKIRGDENQFELEIRTEDGGRVKLRMKPDGSLIGGNGEQKARTDAPPAKPKQDAGTEVF